MYQTQQLIHILRHSNEKSCTPQDSYHSYHPYLGYCCYVSDETKAFHNCYFSIAYCAVLQSTTNLCSPYICDELQLRSTAYISFWCPVAYYTPSLKYFIEFSSNFEIQLQISLILCAKSYLRSLFYVTSDFSIKQCML